VFGDMPPSFTYPTETFPVRSIDISGTPNESTSYYTQYPEPSPETFDRGLYVCAGAWHSENDKPH